MKITVDTAVDSKDEIKKAVQLLLSLAGHPGLTNEAHDLAFKAHVSRPKGLLDEQKSVIRNVFDDPKPAIKNVFEDSKPAIGESLFALFDREEKKAQKESVVKKSIPQIEFF